MTGESFHGAVVECTRYSFRYDEVPHEMKQIGWVLEVKKGRVIGFKSPKVQEE